MNKKALEREEQLGNLRRWIKPGDMVFTILRHVSRSGMARNVSVVVFPDSKASSPIHPNYAVSVVTGARHIHDGFNDAVRVLGVGTDAGFSLVYQLSDAMFPDGFGCLGSGCPSNDHSNGDRSELRSECPGVHRDDEGHNETCHWHTDGGYALRQDWL